MNDALPLDPEALGELVPKFRLVEHTRRAAVRVQRTRVQRSPLAGRVAGEVGDHNMRVQERVAGPAGRVLEPCAKEPAADDGRTLFAARASDGGMTLEIT